MGTLDDMREDIRLARLNNQSYRFMFGVFDFFKGLLKLSLLGFFAVGIWYLTYGYEIIGDSAPPTPESAAANAATSVPSDNEVALSEEQIARLRSFAQQNRDGLAQAENTAVSSDADPITTLAKAEAATGSGQPAVIPGLTDDNAGDVAPSNPDAPARTEITTAEITTEDELPLPDISARSLLAELEQKLGGGTQLAKEADEPESVPSVVESPIIQASISQPLAVVEEPVVAAEASSDNDVTELATTTLVANADKKDNVKELQDKGWVLDQNPDHYLIQMGSTTNHPFLVRFEKQLPDAQPTAIFEMLIGQTAEHTLTYGRFNTKEAATAALGTLSQRARRYGAYVRKISAVQKQIRDLGGDLAVAQKVSGQVQSQ
jgi:septal ring-binding cell division protein DamX